MIGDVGVLERKFPHSVTLQRFDVATHIIRAFNVSLTEHANGPNFQLPIHARKKLVETNGGGSHKRSILAVVIVMPREAQIRKSVRSQIFRQGAVQQRSVREQRDL